MIPAASVKKLFLCGDNIELHGIKKKENEECDAALFDQETKHSKLGRRATELAGPVVGQSDPSQVCNIHGLVL